MKMYFKVTCEKNFDKLTAIHRSETRLGIFRILQHGRDSSSQNFGLCQHQNGKDSFYLDHDISNAIEGPVEFQTKNINQKCTEIFENISINDWKDFEFSHV